MSDILTVSVHMPWQAYLSMTYITARLLCAGSRHQQKQGE